MESPEEVHLSVLRAKVFDNPLLREMILDYAISERRKSRQPKRLQSIRSCRLVSKSWLRSITTIFFKSQQPLFRIGLCNQDEDKTLNQFVSCVTGALCSEERVPPFSIKTYFDYFKKENCQDFFDFLNSYGDSLVELNMFLFESQKLKPLIPTTFLSRLRVFEVIFYMEDTPENTFDFIQSVFNASGKLQSFYLRSLCLNKLKTLALSNLALPQSLTRVHLDCKANDLDLLVNRPLPNLKKLSIKLLDEHVHLKDGLLTSIFRNIGKSLKHLFLEGVNNSKLFSGSPTFKLPLMEKLETFSIDHTFLEADDENLQQLVPALKNVYLANQTSAMFRKWTDRSCFDSVTSLTVSWNESEARREELAENFQLRQMEALHLAFPNLHRLHVTVNKLQDFAGVGVIWREKRNLQYLGIHVRDHYGFGNCREWDALLIGVPEDRVKDLRESPGLWEELQLATTCSIRNLKDLKDLRLTTIEKSRFPMISDAAFRFAFLLMPKLKRVYLEGSFFTTKAIQNECKQRGLKVEMEGDRNYRLV